MKHAKNENPQEPDKTFKFDGDVPSKSLLKNLSS